MKKRFFIFLVTGAFIFFAFGMIQTLSRLHDEKMEKRRLDWLNKMEEDYNKRMSRNKDTDKITPSKTDELDYTKQWMIFFHKNKNLEWYDEARGKCNYYINNSLRSDFSAVEQITSEYSDSNLIYDAFRTTGFSAKSEESERRLMSDEVDTFKNKTKMDQPSINIGNSIWLVVNKNNNRGYVTGSCRIIINKTGIDVSYSISPFKYSLK